MKVFHLKRAIADQLGEADFWYDQSPELKNEFIHEFQTAITAKNPRLGGRLENSINEVGIIHYQKYRFR